jgi:hypothetical protein
MLWQEFGRDARKPWLGQLRETQEMPDLKGGTRFRGIAPFP